MFIHWEHKQDAGMQAFPTNQCDVMVGGGTGGLERN